MPTVMKEPPPKRQKQTQVNKDTYEDTTDIQALRDYTVVPQQLLLYTSDGASLSLRNLYTGRPVFLVCGGPSLNNLDLGNLRRPGVVTFGINNVWSVFRPNLWCCVDRPGNFIDTGWKDPAILKFAPLGKVDANLHINEGKENFRRSKFVVREMPNVLYFRRNEKFEVKPFLTQGTVNWGNHGKVVDELGNKGSRSVMLAALKLIHYLGFRVVYIIGADFNMTESKKETPSQNYAWKQWRHDSSVTGNNSTYKILNSRFKALLPIFKAEKFEVINCTPGGNLNAFPRQNFQKAVDKVAKECEKVVDTEGFYNHDSKM